MKSNNAIYFWKIFYSFVIMFFHFYNQTKEHFIGGRFGVEFYLLTAGVFLFLSYEKQMSERRIQTPYSFLRKRFKRFFPWAFAGFLFAALVARVIIHPLDSFDKAIDCFSGDIWLQKYRLRGGQTLRRPGAPAGEV